MRFFLFILFLGVLPGGAMEEKPKTSAEAPRPNPASEPSIEEVQTMRKILELPPERLAKIRSSIERIERMSPEERKEFAAVLARLENATPEERKKTLKEMRDKTAPGGLGAKVFEYHLKQLPADEAKQERAYFVKLSSEERQQYIRHLLEKYSTDLPKIRAEGKSKDKSKDPNKNGDVNKEGDRAAQRRPAAEAPPVQ
jgi:hypothetical protein